MNGIEIEYFLGLYFIIASLTWEGGRFTADAVKIIAGIALFIMAILRFSFI